MSEAGPSAGVGLAPALCVFGTGSDVGKSWIATGICRLLLQAGWRVAPFKAQNMSNNAGVTALGGELGRAQIVQAEACGLPAHVDMNPVLLKPNTDKGAQVVVLGQVAETMEARAYFNGGMEPRRALVQAALDRLRARYEVVVVEGAGSCAEVNLRDRDLVNMPIAHHADAPVILVADIHRGGVFAQVVGTLEVMPPEDRARVKAILINRFRGDRALFDDGVAWLEARTGLPVLGVVPWTRDLRIESEDGLAADAVVDGPVPVDRAVMHVAVLRLPHISNFTDLLPLRRLGVRVHYLSRPRDLSPYDLLVLPGTKNTRGDLAWLRRVGWETPIQAHRQRGGQVLGICGGYQLLGAEIADPHGVEGEPGLTPGLDLLPVRTTLAPTKTLSLTEGRVLPDGPVVRGYEIHAGITESSAPLVKVQTRDGEPARGWDGCVSADGRVRGTYLHGLFDARGVGRALLGPLRPDLDWPDEAQSYAEWKALQYDKLARHLRENIDVERLFALIQGRP